MTNTNGAESIFGAIPGAGGLSGSARGEAEDAWWGIIEKTFEYAFDTYPEADLGWVPTEEQARDIRRNGTAPAVKERDQEYYGVSRGTGSNYEASRIRDMFARWYLYYPFVDAVAVAKALDFHRSAWDKLTAREHRTVIRRLTTMHDPYEEQNMVPQRSNSRSGSQPPTPTTPRASRWLSYTPEERKVLFDLVQRRKRTLSGK